MMRWPCSRKDVEEPGKPPKKALQDIPETDDFDITAQGGVLILRPVAVGDPGSRLATEQASPWKDAYSGLRFANNF